MEKAKDVLRQMAPAEAYVTFEIATRKVSLCVEGRETAVDPADLLILFQNGWVSRYDTAEGVHHYRITNSGRSELDA